MPRPNKPREVLAETNLAKRIAAERDSRGWTNEGLAKRMTDAGCAMTGSAIFKIEKGNPPRRIVVDELVAFAKVFGVSIEELLLPPELAAQKVLAELVTAWDTANSEAAAAITRRDEAWEAVKAHVSAHPDQAEILERIISIWSEFYFEEDRRDGATALKMWELTRDEKWVQIVREEIDRG